MAGQSFTYGWPFFGNLWPLRNQALKAGTASLELIKYATKTSEVPLEVRQALPLREESLQLSAVES
jgi:hypothetical protein